MSKRLRDLSLNAVIELRRFCKEEMERLGASGWAAILSSEMHMLYRSVEIYETELNRRGFAVPDEPTVLTGCVAFTNPKPPTGEEGEP